MTGPGDSAARTDLRDLLDRPEGWRTQSIPGATTPVRLWRLRLDRATSATVSVVQFPAGWRRPGVGSYSVAEEFVLLSGGLDMNGRHFAAGDWVFVPPGAERTETFSARGAIAVAWFGGVPDWRPDEFDPGAELDVLEAAQRPPVGVLRPPAAPHGGTDVAADQIMPSRQPRDILDAGDWSWWWVPRGASWSEPGRRVFVRSW